MWDNIFGEPEGNSVLVALRLLKMGVGDGKIFCMAGGDEENTQGLPTIAGMGYGDSPV